MVGAVPWGSSCDAQVMGNVLWVPVAVPNVSLQPPSKYCRVLLLPGAPAQQVLSPGEAGDNAKYCGLALNRFETSQMNPAGCSKRGVSPALCLLCLWAPSCSQDGSLVQSAVACLICRAALLAHVWKLCWFSVCIRSAGFPGLQSLPRLLPVPLKKDLSKSLEVLEGFFSPESRVDC